jgi:hypothetical protein
MRFSRAAIIKFDLNSICTLLFSAQFTGRAHWRHVADPIRSPPYLISNVKRLNNSRLVTTAAFGDTHHRIT